MKCPTNVSERFEKHCVIPEASIHRKSHQKHIVNGWLPGQEVQARFHKSSKKLKKSKNRRPWTSEAPFPTQRVKKRSVTYRDQVSCPRPLPLPVPLVSGTTTETQRNDIWSQGTWVGDPNSARLSKWILARLCAAQFQRPWRIPPPTLKGGVRTK